MSVCSSNSTKGFQTPFFWQGFCEMLNVSPCTKQSQLITTFTTLRNRTLKNNEGKEENAGNQHFLLFPHCFLLYQRQMSGYGPCLICLLQKILFCHGTRLKFCVAVRSWVKNKNYNTSFTSIYIIYLPLRIFFNLIILDKRCTSFMDRRILWSGVDRIFVTILLKPCQMYILCHFRLGHWFSPWLGKFFRIDDSDYGKSHSSRPWLLF